MGELGFFAKFDFCVLVDHVETSQLIPNNN